jgi:hypothetical protein
VVYMSQPTAMRGDTETKNCFRIKSKVPFIADRVHPTSLAHAQGVTYDSFKSSHFYVVGETVEKLFRPQE